MAQTSSLERTENCHCFCHHSWGRRGNNDRYEGRSKPAKKGFAIGRGEKKKRRDGVSLNGQQKGKYHKLYIFHLLQICYTSGAAATDFATSTRRHSRYSSVSFRNTPTA